MSLLKSAIIFISTCHEVEVKSTQLDVSTKDDPIAELVAPLCYIP